MTAVLRHRGPDGEGARTFQGAIGVGCRCGGPSLEARGEHDQVRRLRRRGFFKPEAVQALLKRHEAGKEELSYQLWQLLAFERGRSGF